MPSLPSDALILTSSDEATWRLEKKEYKALAADPAQQSFLPLLDSFKLKVQFKERQSSSFQLENIDLYRSWIHYRLCALPMPCSI